MKLSHRLKNPANTLLVLALCLIPVAVPAEESGKGVIAGIEKNNYLIKKGDTLWDISSGKLKNPFLWKKIWKLNPYIKNPDLIFPGRSLNIPGELLKTNANTDAPLDAENPEEAGIKVKVKIIPGKQIPAVNRDYLVSENTLLSSGYISESLPAFAGKITASPDRKSMMGRGDFVFTDAGGPKYYIVSAPERIFHPGTNDVIGYLVRIKGTLESAGIENSNKKALIRDAFEEILIGDHLVEYYSIDLPLMPVAERRPLVNGVIVKVHNGSHAVGAPGVVYLDKGTAQGIHIGDLFTIINGEEPKIPLGTLQIISVREKTSAAVVRKASREIAAGDTFKN